MALDRSLRPLADEHAPYFDRYIRLVGEGDIVATLERQLSETEALLRGLPSERGQHRYAAGKWSVSGVVGHLADAERVFAFRALSFARGEQANLPSFDENTFAELAPFERLSLGEALDEFQIVRRATMSLLARLDEAAWLRRGTANGFPTSPRALAWLTAGHELHHRAILQERYLTS